MARLGKKVCSCFLLALGYAYSQGLPSGTGSFSSLGDRFHYYLHRTYTSRQRLAFLVADSSFGHLLNDPEEWGRGPESFGYRLSSNFGRRMVGNTIEFGVGALLREDARYRRSELRGLRKRIQYATVAAFTARRQDGSVGLAYSRFAGGAGRVLTSSVWSPRPVSNSDLLAQVGFGVLGKIPDNLLDEFGPDLRRKSKHLLQAFRRR